MTVAVDPWSGAHALVTLLDVRRLALEPTRLRRLARRRTVVGVRAVLRARYSVDLSKDQPY